jgi:hypothetical protein
MKACSKPCGLGVSNLQPVKHFYPARGIIRLPTFFFNYSTKRWLHFKLHVTWICVSSLKSNWNALHRFLKCSENSNQKVLNSFLGVPDFWKIPKSKYRTSLPHEHLKSILIMRITKFEPNVEEICQPSSSERRTDGPALGSSIFIVPKLTYLLHGATVLVELWSPHILYVRFRDSKFLRDGGRQPHAQPPTWRTRVSLLVWHLSRNLSGMGPYQQLCCRRHSFRVHWYTSPLTQQQSAFDKVEISLRGGSAQTLIKILFL